MCFSFLQKKVNIKEKHNRGWQRSSNVSASKFFKVHLKYPFYFVFLVLICGVVDENVFKRGTGENTTFAKQSRKKEQDNGHDRYNILKSNKNHSYVSATFSVFVVQISINPLKTRPLCLVFKW